MKKPAHNEAFFKEILRIIKYFAILLILLVRIYLKNLNKNRKDMTNSHAHVKKETSMKMQKRQFRIGELAEQLKVERFVIRFWEKEFEVKTRRSDGGQRFYTPADVDRFKAIKELLYERGFTISGAKQQLKHKKPISDDVHTIIASHKTTFELPEQTIEQITHKILDLQGKLKRLRELLDKE